MEFNLPASKNTRRILLLIPNLGHGGAQRSFTKLANALRIKYPITIAVFNMDMEDQYGLPTAPISLDVRAGSNPFDKLYMLYKRVARLKKLKKQHNISLTISFMEGANYINVLSRQNDKIVLSVRGSKKYDKLINGSLGKLRTNYLIPRLFRKSNKIVTVSEGIANELNKYFGIPASAIVTIPNYYNHEAIRKKSLSIIPFPHEQLFSHPTIVHIGRMHPQKEHQFLLKVFAQLKLKIPQTRLLLIGDGKMRNMIFNEIQRLNLDLCQITENTDEITSADVYWLGFTNNPYPYVKKAQVFVLPSSWEGFPNVLAEAMIIGTPVISADCPTGPREILAPETKSHEYQLKTLEHTRYGILAPMKDKEGSSALWAYGIEHLLNNRSYALEMAMAAQKRMVNFKEERIIEKWEKLIAEICTHA